MYESFLGRPRCVSVSFGHFGIFCAVPSLSKFKNALFAVFFFPMVRRSACSRVDFTVAHVASAESFSSAPRPPACAYPASWTLFLLLFFPLPEGFAPSSLVPGLVVNFFPTGSAVVPIRMVVCSFLLPAQAPAPFFSVCHIGRRQRSLNLFVYPQPACVRCAIVT